MSKDQVFEVPIEGGVMLADWRVALDNMKARAAKLEAEIRAEVEEAKA